MTGNVIMGGTLNITANMAMTGQNFTAASTQIVAGAYLSADGGQSFTLQSPAFYFYDMTIFWRAEAFGALSLGLSQTSNGVLLVSNGGAGLGNVSAGGYSANGNVGISATFTVNDGANTVVFTNGLLTGIS